MIKFYIKRIKMGKITLEDVPEKWREMVYVELCKEKPETK